MDAPRLSRPWLELVFPLAQVPPYSPPNTRPMIAALYCRVSTDEQAAHGVSLAAQEAACLAYCARAGLRVAQVIRDEGESSSTPLLLRPAGARLMELIAAGELRAVVAASQSRLFRDEAEAFRMAGAFGDAGVSLHIIDKGGLVDIASADGLFVYGVTALVDAREVRKLRERVRDAMQHIADTGRFPCSTVYGYKREDKRLVVMPAEAAIIREATARLLSGETARAIALDLEQRNVPTKRGGAWTSTSLLGILRNPVLTGRFTWRGAVLPGDHEPILTDEEQSAVIALSVRRWKSGRRTVRFLSSLFRCGICGGSIACHATDAGGRRYHYLRCVARTVGRVDHCVVSMRYDTAIEAIWGHVEGLLDGRHLETALTRLARERAAIARKDRSAERVAAIDGELARNAQAFAGGLLSYEALAAVNQPLMAEREKLQAALDALAGDNTDAMIEALRALGKRGALQKARRADADVQMAALQMLFARVEVHPGGVLRFVYAGDAAAAVDLHVGG